MKSIDTVCANAHNHIHVIRCLAYGELLQVERAVAERRQQQKGENEASESLLQALLREGEQIEREVP